MSGGKKEAAETPDTGRKAAGGNICRKLDRGARPWRRLERGSLCRMPALARREGSAGRRKRNALGLRAVMIQKSGSLPQP